MCKINKPRIPGLYAGGTKDYGSIVDNYQPILISDSSIEPDKFFSAHITMTRKEYDEHNIYRFIIGRLAYRYPNDTVRIFSKKYKAVSSYLHKLVEYTIKRKALDSSY